MEPCISIVIPTYDRPKRLARALKSCLSQDSSPLEIIVVDNGENPKTEPTVKAAEAMAGGIDIRYLKAEPFNLRDSLATGIEAANGDWIILLDDDDFLVPDRISNDQALVRSLAPEVILLIHDFLRVDYRNSLVWVHHMANKPLGLAEALVLDNFPPPPAGTWRAVALKTFHPFRIPNGWTDFDLYASMLPHGTLSISSQVGYVMDDTRVSGRLTTNPDQTVRMVELHRDRYRDTRKLVEDSDRKLGRRLDQQQAFYAGKVLGVRGLFGSSSPYSRRHPKEFLKGVLAPCRNWLSRLMPDLLPEMRGSKTYSLSHFEHSAPTLAAYIRQKRIEP